MYHSAIDSRMNARLFFTAFGSSTLPSGSSSASCCSGCAASYSFSAAESFGSFVVRNSASTDTAITADTTMNSGW